MHTYHTNGVDNILKVLKGKRRWYFFIGIFIIIFALGTLIVGSIAPSNFPFKSIVVVPEGATVSKVADILVSRRIIRSSFLYKAYVIILHDGKGVRAGSYLFDEPQSALRVAYRTAYGIEGLEKIKVTIPEGLASYDITRLLAKNIPGFDGKSFQALAKAQEGYLFPDTYFFYENTTPQQIITSMRDNFDSHTRGLPFSNMLFNKSIKDIVIMASIVEKEATSSLDRRIIAGVLWKRLAAGMPLQVDPPFFYIFGKTSSQLTLTDLATTSPYNLYKHTGLPPTPIDNPGLSALNDTTHPTKTDYWFYLSDIYGNMHYAATHDGHLVNKEKYIQ